MCVRALGFGWVRGCEGEPVTVGLLPWRGLFRSVLVSVGVCREVTVVITQEETIKEGGGGGADRQHDRERGEGRVCACVCVHAR